MRRTLKLAYIIVISGWVWYFISHHAGVVPMPANPLRGLFYTSLTNTQSTACWMGVFILYLYQPKRQGEMWGILLFGVLLEAYFTPIRYDRGKTLTELFMCLGFGFGLSGWAGLIWRALGPSNSDEEREFAKLSALLAPVLPLGFLGGGWVSLIAFRAHPYVNDVYLYSLDTSFGIAIPFLASAIVTATKVGHWIFLIIYGLLPIFMLAATVYTVKNGKREGIYFDVMLSCMFCGLVGSSLYGIYPATGPANTFGPIFHQGDWSNIIPGPSLGKLQQFLMPENFSRKAMPSLHATWGLLVLLAFCRQSSRTARWAGHIFFVGTLISALFVGHYFLDFIVALPLTLLAVSLTAYRHSVSTRIKIQTMLLSLALLFCCYGVLLLAYPLFIKYGILTLLFELFMVGAFVYLERRLYHSTPENKA